MGAWDLGPFDNDGAGELLNDLAADASWATVETALAWDSSAGIGDEQALAAVAVVALSRGMRPAFETPEEVGDFLDRVGDPARPEITTRALRALEQLTDPTNDLRIRVEESDALEEWLGILTALTDALHAPATARKGKRAPKTKKRARKWSVGDVVELVLAGRQPGLRAVCRVPRDTKHGDVARALPGRFAQRPPIEDVLELVKEQRDVHRPRHLA